MAEEKKKKTTKAQRTSRGIKRRRGKASKYRGVTVPFYALGGRRNVMT